MTREDVDRIVEALRAKLLEEVGEGEEETQTPAQAARERLSELPAHVRIKWEWNWEWMFKEGVKWALNDIRDTRSTDESLVNWAERFLDEIEERGTA